MSSRLDRLVSLLDTGSSSAIRLTAAKQLSQLATKSVASNLSFQTAGEDAKSSTTLHAPQADYDTLMSVVARILPCLRSKNFETRTAASSALSNICTSIPVWSPGGTEEPPSYDDNDAPAFPSVDLVQLMYSTPSLVASSGQEFSRSSTTLGSVNDVKRAKKEAMKRLGLDFLEGVTDDSMDWEKELEEAPSTPSSNQETAKVKQEEVKMEGVEPSISASKASTPAAPSPTNPSVTPDPPMSAGPLSARELNRLKRKRKGTNAAVVPVHPPKATADSKYGTAPAAEASAKVRITSSKASSSLPGTPAERSPPPTGTPPEKVIVDPSKGGQIEAAKGNQLSLSKVIEVADGEWPWAGVIRLLELDLFDPVWSTRHGAACAIRDIVKPQGTSGGMNSNCSSVENQRNHEKWCNDLAGKVLCILVLDRFCDFSNDTSVSPVRETVAQTLASLFIHMPHRSLKHVHDILLDMIQQGFTREGTSKPYIWQVRHGGMLGLKYEVAVRRDLLLNLKVDETVEDDASQHSSEGDSRAAPSTDVLRSVVTSAILGLGDSDDDVRSVAASTLLPVATDLVKHLPTELSLVLAVLWDGLANMKDDLSSSVGAVMELLGKLAAFPEVIEVLASETQSKSLSVLAPILFSFFRHTIPNVRLQVVTTLHAFLTVPDLPKDWISVTFLSLVFQNLILEERENVRTATVILWRTCIDLLSNAENALQATVSSPLISDWFAIMLQPWGQALNSSLFCDGVNHNGTETNGDAKSVERHNVDKAMLAQDASLVSTESIWEARLASAGAIGYLIYRWPNIEEADTVFRDIILHYLCSSSALQRVVVCAVIEEYAKQYQVVGDSARPSMANELPSPPLGKAISETLLGIINNDPPPYYHEIAPNLRRLSLECTNLLSSFVSDGHLTATQVPQIPTEIDGTGQRTDAFTVNVAEQVSGTVFEDLKKRLVKIKKKELSAYEARRATIIASITLYNTFKERHEVRSMAACASALVALKAVPAKVGSVVKNIMNGVKFEESLVFQTRFAAALASMVDLGLSVLNAPLPITKVVKNLCAFLCSDPTQTPSFATESRKTAGVFSFKTHIALGKEDPREVESEETSKARTSRRGAGLALVELSHRFGDKLFDVVPMIWESTTDGLLSTCGQNADGSPDDRMEKRTGQDVIDSMVTLQTVVAALHPTLWAKVLQLLPPLLIALKSRFAIIRQSAAKCLAVICDVITVQGMRCVIENVLPLLGDALSVTNRQGAIEAIFHIVRVLEVKLLPYLIFLVVPVLGRMSDTDDDIRSTATNAFASLVKMVPLEAGLPDPVGFPAELLERRDEERQFLSQLLDGSKVEQYKIPVPIEAELRKYQQDGVNWLAFLAKYQLHGILCDDMGLGKTLQSICILASKHFERSEQYSTTKSPEFAHLPSLIICPPTLTGHWFYEIGKYASTLKPILYTGTSRDRAKVLPLLSKRDIVVTSYEVVRNDIQSLEKMEWLYCILDEGHIIKNGKTKLTKSVKQIRAQHRLILSGTPIQNNVLELWSLFDFLMPGFLGSEQSFNERYGKPILANRDSKANAKTSEAAALALESLHKQVLPFLLRRLKEDVLNDLPPKIIQDYYCELSELQKQLYDEFAESQVFHDTQSAVQGGGGKQGQQHVFQALQYLKKLCNHPALVLKEEAETTKVVLAKYRQNAEEANPLRDIQHAPKLQALRQLLLDCGIGTSSTAVKTSGDFDMDSAGAFSQHRVLIFCQMKQMLDMIETDLFKVHMPSVTYMRLDGGTDTNKRHAIVQTFNGDPSIDCLLLTTHVGGLGLTLTGADTVIFVEHDWNPMKDLQAMDRAHRIGQKKVVNVYRLITKDTLEEKIMGLQRFKLNIANSVINQQNSGLSSMGTDMVLDLFKRTPQHEADTAAKQRQKEGTGQKNVLAGLEELPSLEEYDSLDIDGFLATS